MKVYRVEFFNFQNTWYSKLSGHGYTNEFKYKFDYLNPENNDIEVYIKEYSDIRWNDLIIIIDGKERYYGLVSKIKELKYSIKITFKSIYTLFQQKVLINTDYQSKTGTDILSLEEVIKENLFLNDKNLDSLVNIMHHTEIEIESETKPWSLNLKSDFEGSHYCLADLYHTLLIRGLIKYGIYVDVKVREDLYVSFNDDLTSFPPSEDQLAKKQKIKLIEAVIRKNNKEFVKRIECDLPNIINVDIKDKSEESVNSIRYYDKTGQSVTYVIHNDGTIDSNIYRDRIYPFIEDAKTVDTSEKTLIDAALEDARTSLKLSEYNNSIEIEILRNDKLINPSKWQIGQIADIVRGNKTYRSIYTGYEIGETFIMKFGTVRSELTKKLRGER